MTNNLPELALSVRQPWAWSLIYGGKPVENRSWKSGNPGLAFRGPLCIHAAGGMTRDEYDEASAFMATIGVTCPPAAELQRGGIIGTAVVKTIVRHHPSPWFFGPRALVLTDVKAVPFIPCAGQLGFFKWTEAPGGAPLPAARWMLAKPTSDPQGSLL